MARIVWSARAQADLAEIHAFVRRDSSIAAASLVLRIMAAARRLAEFPESGRLVPELIPLGLREVLVGSYRIVYDVDQDVAGVVTVRHAARGLTEKDIRQT